MALSQVTANDVVSLSLVYVAYVTSSRVSLCRTPHDSISGSDKSVVYLRARKLSGRPADGLL